MKKLIFGFVVVMSAVGGALSQPLHNQPGSVLIYPLFDSQPTSATVINVTNTNEDRGDCGNGFRSGDIRLHYVYFGKQADDSSACQEYDRFEFLTPSDTLTLLASDHNPEGEVGFVTVQALDPETTDYIDFDFLIGSSYVANSAIDIMWSYTPYSFLGINTSGTDECLRGIISPATFGFNFDGVDYSTFPDRLIVDSFFEENQGIFENRLTLMSTSGRDFINEISVLIWNNQEDRFSRTFKFVCHTTVSISDISSVAKDLGGDPGEFNQETGWMSLDGRAVLNQFGNDAGIGEPAILGVFVQIVRSDFTAGHALHYEGSMATTLFL